MSFSISIKSRDADSTTDFPRWSLDWLRWFLAQPHEDLLTAVRELAQELDDLAETDSQRAFLDARALNRAAREYLRTLGTPYTEDHPLLEETRKILEPHQRENEASERSLRLPRMSGGMLNTIH
ncbi:MAG: hypothetical protein ACRDK2_14430, partial [Solirubrobacteraceae bacterium]